MAVLRRGRAGFIWAGVSPDKPWNHSVENRARVVAGHSDCDRLRETERLVATPTKAIYGFRLTLRVSQPAVQHSFHTHCSTNDSSVLSPIRSELQPQW